MRAVEFFGEDHGRVRQIDAVVCDGLAEGELGVADHGGGDVEWSPLILCFLKEIEWTEVC